jgi:hydroxypyruvate reductase
MADLKQLARQIFYETLAAIDIPATMQRKLRREGTRLRCDGKIFDLREFDKLRVVAIGKAAHAMVEGLALVLAPFVRFEGVVSAPTVPRKPLPGMKYFVAGHPIPNEESWKAAEAALALLKNSDEKTLVFFLLSGGGSALMELPLERSLTLEDVQQMNRTLVTCGASIEEMNALRKHVSAVKGGRLATAAGRATKLSLAVTDVPAGNESALASGPTLPDPTSVAYVAAILEKYELLQKFPSRLRQWIESGKVPETPKSGHPCFANAHFLVLLGMDDLFHPAHHAAEAKGCVTRCDNSTDDWPVDLAAEFLLEQLAGDELVSLPYENLSADAADQLARDEQLVEACAQHGPVGAERSPGSRQSPFLAREHGAAVGNRVAARCDPGGFRDSRLEYRRPASQADGR